MRDVVAEDDVSAGKGAYLDADVVDHLIWVGESVGPVLDKVRKAVNVINLRQVKLPGCGQPHCVNWTRRIA